MALGYCYFFILCFVVLAVVTNVIMVIHIFKNGGSANRAGFMFKFIAISNATYSICLCFHAVETNATRDVPLTLAFVVSAATGTSFYLQLGFNLSLAFERYQIIANAVRYHTAEAKNRLERRLSIAVFTFSFIMGLNFSSLRFLLKNLSFFTVPMAVSRIVGNISLCVLYFKLYLTMKSNNQSIAATSAEKDVPPTSNNELMTRRMKHLEHSKRFFIGITSTFFILNLPLMIVFFITSEAPPCNTLKGILSILSVCLSIFNMVFDPIWYFYMDRRSKRL